MPQLILDAHTADKLQEFLQPVDLCHPSGRIVGRFVPQVDLSKWTIRGPELTREELERRANSTEWLTTSDVMAILEKLECSGSDGTKTR